MVLHRRFSFLLEDLYTNYAYIYLRNYSLLFSVKKGVTIGGTLAFIDSEHFRFGEKAAVIAEYCQQMSAARMEQQVLWLEGGKERGQKKV